MWYIAYGPWCVSMVCMCSVCMCVHVCEVYGVHMMYISLCDTFALYIVQVARGCRARGDANSQIGYLLIVADFVNFL